MRILLANGTKVPIKSYSNTTAVVNGNTLPALSIVVSEPLDKAKEKFSNADALIDFNIYPDDKSTVLLHAIGYQKRVSIAIGDDESCCTVLLAKTGETDEILKTVEKSLKSIEGVTKTHDESINSIKETLDANATTQKNTTKKLDALDKTVGEVLVSLQDIKLLLNNTATHLNENDKLCKQVKDAVDEFTEISSNQLSEVQSLRNDVSTAAKVAAGAVKTADSAANTVVKQNDAVVKAINDSSSAKSSVDDLGLNMQNTIKKLSEVSGQVDDVAKLANEINSKSADAGKVNELIKSINVMKDNISSTKESINKVKKSVNVISGTTIPSITNQIDDVKSTTEKLKSSQEEIQKTATNASKEVSAVNDTLGAVDTRLKALEPVTDYTTLSLDEAKNYRISESNTILAEYLAANPITSTCHKGVAAQYSITKDKQDYLQAMINVTQLAKQAGVDYQPSWNATGEVCSYDWTLEELCQLAMEIEVVVRPLVSYQQTIETEIRNCKSMEELQAISIDYSEAKSHISSTVEDDASTSTKDKSSDIISGTVTVDTEPKKVSN